ncbi:hypothetical protein EVAR_65020_1 [Eumeta japonica]|uniref:Uncharacterized protein n=1 Tax=Eumeta variegata TaxID=151549 RepID=A0A4C1ZVN2_EUMVA|nr:hypothetical protein EVAR_65020_1 [Eumeta japonica]
MVHILERLPSLRLPRQFRSPDPCRRSLVTPHTEVFKGQLESRALTRPRHHYRHSHCPLESDTPSDAGVRVAYYGLYPLTVQKPKKWKKKQRPL